MDEGKGNIFDEASKKVKKKKKKKKISSVQVPLPQKKFKDPEMNSIFQKIYEMNDEIRQSVDRITESKGITRQGLYDYFEDPTHFTSKELEAFEEQKKSLEKKLIPILGPKWKERLSEKKKKLLTKKRKGKTIGGRKGWLPMR